jgi:hypothetical protein
MATQVTLNSGSVDSAGSLALKTNGTTTAVTINASQGVEFNAGAVGTPSITTTGDTNTGIFFPAADTIAFSEGGVESMRIDSSGNVGIGTSSPVGRLRVKQSSGDSFTNGFSIQRTATSDTYGWVVGGDNGLYLGYATNASGADANVDFSTRMLIDSSGSIFAGATTLTGTLGIINAEGVVGSKYAYRSHVSSTGENGQMSFTNPNGLVGSINTNGSATSYQTSSDYRLKHDISPMAGALARVALLKPCTYKWNADGSNGEGFIAHELAEVCPSAVSGKKDAVNEDGSIKPQGIDTSFLVATLTAAIQELKALVDTQASTITQLQADVAALKGTA